MDAAHLADWQIRCGFRTDAPAAAAIGLSVGAYRNQKKGRNPVGKQTALLCKYVEVHNVRWLTIARNCYELAAVTSQPVTPAAKAAVIDLVADAPTQDSLRR